MPRVPGTAVFMTLAPVGTPSTLLHNVKHNHILHEKVVLLSIITKDTPTVPAGERIKLTDLGQGFYRVEALLWFHAETKCTADHENCRPVWTRYRPDDHDILSGKGNPPYRGEIENDAVA